MPSRPFRWLLYPLAWLPFVALFVLTGIAEGSVGRGLAFALYYIVPPAVLGVGVIRACVAMPWSSDRWGWFFARHFLLALLFAGLSGAGTAALSRLFPVQMQGPGEPEVSVWSIIVGALFVGFLLYGLLVGFTYAAIGEIGARQQAEVAARAEALRAQAELKALRAQVNPHFLFNTLHSLLALVRKDPRAAEEALEQFGGLMRYALRIQQEAGDEVPLAEEWAFAEDYLALEKLRLGDRLQVHADIDGAALGHTVPAFSLQPLLENSIGHAIARHASGGNLWIRAAPDRGRLVLEVRDDGKGATEEAIEASSGTGLRLLRRRLDALYGNEARLTTTTTDAGFSVVVEVPASVRPARRPTRKEEPGS